MRVNSTHRSELGMAPARRGGQEDALGGDREVSHRSGERGETVLSLLSSLLPEVGVLLCLTEKSIHLCKASLHVVDDSLLLDRMSFQILQPLSLDVP